MSTRYRLGLDVGANSIGWCMLDLDDNDNPTAIRDMGVRIFSDGRNPKDKTSLAVARRTARGMRRRRDRYLRRRARLMDDLVRHGLMPEDEAARKTLETLDPYEIRARGLDETLTPHELGRALFHLNQRRGFKSNRKTDTAEDDKESGKIKSAASKLTQAMKEEDARTLGEFLWRRHQGPVRQRQPVRVRMRGEGAKAEYEYYPQRDMLAAEFDALWRAQEAHHPDLLTAAARARIEETIFFQRNLRPVRPGKCTFEPTEERAPWALPLAQKFRIYQELNNLKLVFLDRSKRPLTIDERDRLAAVLLKTDKLTKQGGFAFAKMRRLLALDSDVRFSHESEKRKHLDGDKTAHVLSRDGLFGLAWHEFDADAQDEIVARLLDEEDEAALVNWLVEAHGLDQDAAGRVAAARLPDGYGRLGRTALGKIVSALVSGRTEAVDPATGEVFEAPLTYDAAVVAAGYEHHSDLRLDGSRDELPYYAGPLDRHVGFGSGEPDDPEEKRLGRLANPTVHIGLNQVRRIVNALIAEHGKPAEVVIELARELKQSRERQQEIEREQAENQRKNDARREELAKLGQADNGENRLRLRLWEELNPGNALDRRCVYTGEPISIGRLFGPEVEIEHILPFSKTLDNSAANKTVSLRRANRDKGNRAPFAAFRHGPASYDWDGILERADALPKNKSWRFGPDAMERFAEKEAFLDRHLTDTQYLARIARQYLTAICPPNEIWSVPGRLTAMLRGKWGLNSLLWDHNLKKRVDHRHHAIDALVVGLTDRGLLNEISRLAGRAEERGLARLLDDMPTPWEGFRDDARAALDRIAVSHRPNHGKAGRLHEDTAYGMVADPTAEDGHNLVFRKPLVALNDNEIGRIRDSALRTALRDHVTAVRGAGKKLPEALAEFSDQTGVRRVRLLKKEAAVIPVTGPDGRPYKALVPGDNHCIEIYALPNGKWAGAAISVFAANQPKFDRNERKPHPAARLVMRVRKGDLVALDDGGPENIMRVVRLEIAAGRLRLAGHREAGDLEKRHNDPEDPFRWTFASFGRLRESGARRVRIDARGRINDPGPPE